MPLLQVRDLRVSFVTEGRVARVIDGVSLDVPRGKTVALVGETGCGKSVTALSIMRLLPQPPAVIDGGQIVLRGDQGLELIDLLKLPSRMMRRIRGHRIAMIFQEPLTSLNPVLTVGEQVVEAIELHQPLRRRSAWNAAVEMFHTVGISDPSHRARDYPHEMSGGMRQRVMIAMALACRPALLIADEPTTALDVTIQLQILELLVALQVERGMSVLIITHDLGVVAETADYVYVMYAGRIVEHGCVNDLFGNPLHPYTRGLFRCLPRPGDSRDRLDVIPGQVPDPMQTPPGCRFHPRCELAARRADARGRLSVPISSAVGDSVLKRCITQYGGEPSGDPPLREVEPGHFAACWEVGAPRRR